jgi:DNA polymerase-3 subunit alpha
VRRFCKRTDRGAGGHREQLLLAGIVNDLRVINGQRGKLALFKLDDKTDMIEAAADEACARRQPQLVQGRRTDRAMAKLQPDRFSGGFR